MQRSVNRDDWRHSSLSYKEGFGQETTKIAAVPHLLFQLSLISSLSSSIRLGSCLVSQPVFVMLGVKDSIF